ncbi:MAG: DEAD/DEAH box helicase, partial [Bacteroidota bacterium]
WYLESTESCLELLLELDSLRQQDQIVIEWPKGQKLKLAGQAGFENLKVKVGGNQNWFKLDGEIRVNEDEILSLQLLLKAIREGGESQFLTLDDGRYLALTDQLRKQLKDLAAFSQEKRGQVGLHPLMAEGLEALGEQGAQLKVNAAWKRQIKQLKEARNYQPRLPQNLQADLRPYQEDGYHWMARLAHWGVGACLADDMGLGKTVQALAMLLSRGNHGPSLVVAPASVVRNWRKEAEKFAPELNPILLGESQRTETIAELRPYDLLLTSYNLMQMEIDHLSTVNFSMVVLDEAQAIKNTQAKRSKAAKTLQAQFKLLTTGTPIENHLGELWNLFDFLNPGLLGSLEHFNARYATPIERDQDAERKSQLRKLLRPFILRRRKSEVLEELPEKTEITLSVELSESERAFYEALRRNALSSLAKAEGNNPGEQRMKILAEITRLRQAACHPDLVAPEMALGSSKLKLFGEVLTELRENGHKALVFSQFVKYLKLIEAYVQAQGVSYQYLDGQTPMKQREKRVEAFQRGQGDVFLISLKAGGVGLNLTAADYVIHLDPWWNPAVEDQASDRAHRIGQQRPVTVYRLVAEQTIEEKIVRLHQRKRDLADSLLEGTDRGGKLSSEELMALISEA